MAKLYIFVDAAFANNQGLSSQLGCIFILANEVDSAIDNPTESTPTTFKIRGNIIHWTSVKCQRVTRSILAAELYALVHGIDLSIALGTTLQKITTQLSTPNIPIIACTDSYSLYECIVKLGTTKEKRLMIDIMATRESYERHEIEEVRWILGNDNPADALTKANGSKALEQLIATNELAIHKQGWVNRALKTTEED